MECRAIILDLDDTIFQTKSMDAKIFNDFFEHLTLNLALQFNQVTIDAIIKDLWSAAWDLVISKYNIPKEEAQNVYDLYRADKIREIYFTEHKNALLILETKDKKEALKILSSLPLVMAGMIKFEILELKPYTGLERIMHQL